MKVENEVCVVCLKYVYKMKRNFHKCVITFEQKNNNYPIVFFSLFVLDIRHLRHLKVLFM